ncbi:MAG TPA: M24 family metallopeptidase, partial [Clostridia bacterium]|nr:M24 family metallopeptidase [Clostridia bacterium]
IAMRSVKSSEEITQIEQALQVTRKMHCIAMMMTQPGMTENQVAAEIEYYMRKNGASAPAFETIVASGKRSSMPHGHASNKVIEKGDPVTMDFGALVDGYNSDMTRTVFAGEPAGKMKDIYKIVLEAQCASEEMVHAGLTGLEIDRIARDIIYDAGYEGCFGHGLGHGLGIEVHEMPRLSATYPYPIENGNVLSVEPGIYVEGLGGVRIENLVMVRDKNPLVFNKSSKEMIIL